MHSILVTVLIQCTLPLLVDVPSVRRGNLHDAMVRTTVTESHLDCLLWAPTSLDMGITTTFEGDRTAKEIALTTALRRLRVWLIILIFHRDNQLGVVGILIDNQLTRP